MKHPSDISDLVLHYTGDGTMYTTDTGTATPANAEDVGTWEDEVEDFQLVQATASRRPRYYDYVIGGKPGVTFFGDQFDTIIRSSSAKAITGDMTIAVYTTTPHTRRSSSTANIVQHGDGESTATQEVYDYRYIGSSDKDAGWFHEHSGGSNVIVQSTISAPLYPFSGIARRDVTLNDIDFDVDGSTNNQSYGNDTSGGGSGMLALGCFQFGGSFANAFHGWIMEVAIYDRRLTDQEVVDLQRYFVARYEQRRFSLSEDSTWALSDTSNVQSIDTDGTYIWVTHDDDIYRYNVSGGTALDSRDTSGDGIGLTSWGGSYVYNDELYLVRFSSSQASRIYKIDSTDFSSAPTLEKTLSDLPQNGVNGLVRLPNGKWICGFTSSGDVKQDNQLYILNSSFNHETTIDYAGTQEFGIQDLTIGPNGEIYASGHGDNDETDLFRFRYDGSTLIQEWQFRFSNLSNQGMAYANGVFYTATRDTGPAMTVRLNTLTTPHDDEQRLIHHRRNIFKRRGLLQR